MSTFPLKIVTPDGVQFDGTAEKLIVRTTSGDTGILAGHTNYVAPLGMGRAAVTVDGKKRCAACIGGMISVADGSVTLVPTTFEWSEDIDVDRAEKSKRCAQKILEDKTSTDTDILLAQARLKRALVRTGVAEFNKKT